MSITVIPGAHLPKLYPPIQAASSVEHLLQLSFPTAYYPNETRIVAASSFVIPDSYNTTIYPSHSSLVHSAIEAWGRHAHLVVRPEDIWFTILIQMNFFMDSHEEQLRHIFVANHKEKKEPLHVDANSWNQVIDWFRAALQARLTAPWMSDWIAPGFTTTTHEDEQTATILMMGMMRHYFDYSGGITCGIPSVTVRGTQADWRRLLRKVDRLKDFGDEPAIYADRLRPILTRIAKSFDDPTDSDTRAFWDQIVQAKYEPSGICGVSDTRYVVTGWIVGLFFWDAKGKRLLQHETTAASLEYDGVHYSDKRLEDLSMGYARANFKMVNDHGGPEGEFDGWVLAGNIGTNIVHQAPAGYHQALAALEASDRSENSGTDHGTGSEQNLPGMGRGAGDGQHVMMAGMDSATMHSTIQPLSGWFLFGPAKGSTPFHDSSKLMTSGSTIDTLKDCVDHTDHRFTWHL